MRSPAGRNTQTRICHLVRRRLSHWPLRVRSTSRWAQGALNLGGCLDEHRRLWALIGVPLAETAPVLLKARVKLPMQPVRDAPAAAHGLGESTPRELLGINDSGLSLRLRAMYHPTRPIAFKQTMLRSEMSILDRLSTLSWRDHWLLLEAGICLGLARAAVLTLPLRRIMAFLGHKIGIADSVHQPLRSVEIQRVAWAIRVVRRRTPWNSNCLAQALAGQKMLHRRGIASTLFLGVLKEGDSGLAAHAWVCSSDVIVTGGNQLDRYAVIVSFANPG
jgi:hypothetical protein